MSKYTKCTNLASKSEFKLTGGFLFSPASALLGVVGYWIASPVKVTLLVMHLWPPVHHPMFFILRGDIRMQNLSLLESWIVKGPIVDPKVLNNPKFCCTYSFEEYYYLSDIQKWNLSWDNFGGNTTATREKIFILFLNFIFQWLTVVKMFYRWQDFQQVFNVKCLHGTKKCLALIICFQQFCWEHNSNIWDLFSEKAPPRGRLSQAMP